MPTHYFSLFSSVAKKLLIIPVYAHPLFLIVLICGEKTTQVISVNTAQNNLHSSES
jgi:hypothetical protein